MIPVTVNRVDDDDLREYDLDNYDNDDDEVVYGSDDGEGQSMGMFNSIKSLAYHQPGEADPYITLADVGHPSLLHLP